MSNLRSITPLPDANFTPELGNYKTLQPFRYWCQKVLPLVYDDSLSYYELLCKVVDYLNKTMEDVETLHGDVTNLHTAYEELQAYVNNYFSTLDVQEEINNKLDSLVLDGTLPTLINNLFSNTINPVFVDNVSKMTDHNKQYVLTTDASGHIWYWNGSQFTKSSTLFGNTNILFKFNSYIDSSNGDNAVLNTPSDGWYWLYNNNGKPFAGAPYSSVRWIGSLDVKRYVHSDGVINITETLVIMESVSKRTHTLTRIYRNEWTEWTEVAPEVVKFNSYIDSSNGDNTVLNTPSDGWYWLFNNNGKPFAGAPYFSVNWVGSLDVKRYVAPFDDSVNITETLVIMESVSKRTHTLTRIYRDEWTEWTEVVKFNSYINSTYDDDNAILNTPSDGWYWLWNNRGKPFAGAPYSSVNWIGSLDVKRYVEPGGIINITETLVIMESVSKRTHTLARIYRNAWNEWTEVAPNVVKFNSFINSRYDGNAALNTPSDGWYWLFNDNGKPFAGAPYSSVNWIGSLDVKRYAHSDGIINITETLVIMESVSKRTHTLTRIYRNEWNEWTELATKDKNENYVDFNLSAFDSIVSIGDSLSCGYQRINGSIISNNYELSPFQYFVKKYGTKVFWGGASGATTVELINNETSKYKSSPYVPKGMNYVESLGAKALYVISLGTNDSQNNEQKVPLGSPETVNDRTTFYGALNYIVTEINRIAPSAYVLLVSGFNVNVNNEYRINAPKYIASLHNNAIFIDITEELKQLTKYTRDGHYVTFGYYSIGAIIDSVGGKAIAENNNAWLDVGNANVNSTDTDINPYEKA